MKNTKILEMLNNGNIEELKRQLQEEIYMESLNGNSTAKKRYRAMKKYCTITNRILKETPDTQEIFRRACKIPNMKHNGQDVIAFCNGCSIALTTETINDIELCPADKYIDVAKFFNYKNLISEKVNINKILTKAKNEGYKFKQSALQNRDEHKYFFRHNNGIFNIPLIEITYNIINNNEEAIIYHNKKATSPLFIENSIGKCIILPICQLPTGHKGSHDDNITIIEL